MSKIQSNVLQHGYDAYAKQVAAYRHVCSRYSDLLPGPEEKEELRFDPGFADAAIGPVQKSMPHVLAASP